MNAPNELPFHTFFLVFNRILFTYEVVWEKSEIKWASRWDLYLTMPNASIHWFSIMNSLFILFFLSSLLTTIIIRTLRK